MPRLPVRRPPDRAHGTARPTRRPYRTPALDPMAAQIPEFRALGTRGVARERVEYHPRMSRPHAVPVHSRLCEIRPI